MKTIQLTQGMVAIVDDEDFHLVVRYKWHYAEGYARTDLKGSDGKYRSVSMHRMILNTPKGMETDHINGDRLDNRRENIRVCTKAQNLRNVAKRTNNSSGMKGVYKSRNEKWVAQIRLNGKSYYLGIFSEKVEAAMAYNEAAKKFHGEFARLNVLV